MLEKLTTAAKVAQGRLDYGPPVAVIDIGSNSVRLVVYEGVTRSPTPLFNEKTLAGLGREVQTKGLLASDAVEKALTALKRFRALCDTMQVERLDLVEGEYLLDVAVHARDGHPYDYHSRLYAFAVRSRVRDTGVARLAHRWRLQQGAGDGA